MTSPIAPCAIFFASLSSALLAQAPMFGIYGNQTSSYLGMEIERLGDLDKDGISDLLTSAPLQDLNGNGFAGEVYVLSGKDASKLLTLNDVGTPNCFRFGDKLSAMGDTNGDGYPDFLVGSEHYGLNGNGSGIVRLYSGKTGTPIYTWSGADANDAAGVGRNVGDVNGDGVNDVGIGARYDEAMVGSSGSVRVYSGKTGTLLYAFAPPANTHRFGSQLAGGDLNNDGRSDIVVGAEAWNASGYKDAPSRVFAYSGLNGGLMFTITEGAGESIGRGFEVVSDKNGDGKRDIALHNYPAGGVFLHSGANGARFHTFTGDFALDYDFGAGISEIPDLTLDGVPDLLIASGGDQWFQLGTHAGRIHLIDGASKQTVWIEDALPHYSGIGISAIQWIGDVNFDGWPDFATGFDYADSGLLDQCGQITIHSGKSGSWGVEGVGCAGTTAFVPQFTFGEYSCFSANGSVHLQISGVHGAAFGLVVIGASPASQKLGPCTLLVAPNVVTTAYFSGPAVPGAGGLAMSVKLPFGIPPGTTYAQVIASDPVHPGGLAASARVRMTID